MDKTLLNIENELKKRLAYPYRWGTKQTNDLDALTRFIYKTTTFESLLAQIESNFETVIEKEALKNYALNRWFNFQSAKAVETIFKAHPIVSQTNNAKDKEKDFFINNIPFDHKTTVFPKRYTGTFNEAINQPKQLIEWLYTNQSQQGRHHLKNRLFVVLYDSKGKHWQLKAQLQKIEQAVHQYLQHFSAAKLYSFSFEPKISQTPQTPQTPQTTHQFNYFKRCYLGIGLITYFVYLNLSPESTIWPNSNLSTNHLEYYALI